MSERIDVFSALKNPPVKRKQWESFGSYCNFIINRVRKTAWLCETGGVENLEQFWQIKIISRELILSNSEKTSVSFKKE